MGRRSTHNPDQLRELIVSAATELIVDRGLAALSAREIARRVAYSPGTIYNVFQDLDHLIFTIEGRMLGRLRERLALIPTQVDPARGLIDMATAYLAFSLEQPRLWNVLLEHVPASSRAMPAEFTGEYEAIIVEVERFVRPLVSSGNPDHIHRVTAVLWASLHGITALTTSQKIPLVTADVAAKLVEDLVANFVAGLDANNRPIEASRPKKRITAKS